MRNKTIPIPIYFGKLTIIVTNDWMELDIIYKIKVDEKLYDAVVFEIKENDEYILAIKKVEWSIIAHEVVHLVNAIFLKCGVELDRQNDEPQAYLTGWIINEIDKHIKENEQFNLLKIISDCREKVDAELPFGKEDAYDSIINEIDKNLKKSIQVGDITEKGIVDTVGNCANCGVEFHIHKKIN